MMSGSRSFTVAVFLLLAVAIGASYANSLGIGFLFDDSHGIEKNPAIRSLGNIPRFFTDPFTLTQVRENVDVRPVLVVTYAANYAISGLDPWSYHLLNMIFHWLAAGLVFVIVRDHLWWPDSERGPGGSARFPAAATALFFAVAPLNSQALNYMWARSALLCTLFYLAAFLAIQRRHWVAGALLHGMALLTKAIAVTLPVMLLIQDYLYRDRSRHPTLGSYVRDWRRLVLPIGLPSILNLIYLAYRWALLPGWAESTRHPPWVNSWIWFMSQWSALLHYVRQFVWPDGLSIDNDFPYTVDFAETRAWLPLLVIIVWLVLATRVARRYPQVTFATLWFFVVLAPESSFLALAEVVNDHRPYIATSLGLALLLAWVLERGVTALVRQEQRRWIVYGVLCLALALPAVAVNRYRSWQWSDSLRLWEDTVTKGPTNARAWMNAGLVHMRRGQLAEYAYMNLSALERMDGNKEQALDAAREAVRLKPNLAPGHYYVGRALEDLGRRAEALDAYRRAVELNPDHVASTHALARLSQAEEDGPEPEEARVQASIMEAGVDALYRRDDPATAIDRFREVLARNPTHYGATYQLAAALDRAGRREEARALWEQTLRMAEEFRDEATAAKARSRLEGPD